MEISQVMTSQTQPNIHQLWWKNKFQPICTRSDWFFAVTFYYVYSKYEYTSFVTMATYWFPDLPDIKSFPGRPLRCILTFANGPSSARCRKHINKLGQVFGLLKCFLNIKSSTIMKSDWGDWKRVSCQGKPNFYSSRYVACRTITPPSFSGLCLKLTKIVLLVYLMLH